MKLELRAATDDPKSAIQQGLLSTVVRPDGVKISCGKFGDLLAEVKTVQGGKAEVA